MKIITWNCNMAFRKKAHVILRYNPDILVVPECEHPDKIDFKEDKHKPTTALWFGENLNKGLAIFSYGNYKLNVLSVHNENIRTIIPIIASNEIFEFNLFAIWANNPNDRDGRYVEQIWKAIHHYEQFLGESTLLVGDFNSNSIWDRKHKIGTHTNVVKHLEDKAILSTYHIHFKQSQGKEAHPTLYMYRHKNKAYHIDYCFASANMIRYLDYVEVGEYDFWTKYSDHMPMMVNFKFPQ